MSRNLYDRIIQVGNRQARGMEDSSRWLSASMVLWLPGIYLTTYLGFFEAYELARSNELFSLDYTDNYPVFLIIPAMIPTMFTAYTIINRKRMVYDLINKFNTFHDQTQSGKPGGYGLFLTDYEFGKLPLEDKYQYCIDLNQIGEQIQSTKFRQEIYSSYWESRSLRERAIANMAKTGMKTEGTAKTEFEHSKLAFQLMKDEPKDKLYFNTMFAYLSDSKILGYEESLRLVEEIDSELSPEFDYWKIRLYLLRLKLIFRMNPSLAIEFDQVEVRMNLHRYNKDELRSLERSFASLKKEVLLKQNRLEEFEILTLNKMYLSKWTGRYDPARKNDLARLYRKQGKFDKSLEIFNQLLSLHNQDKNKQRYCIALINIGKTYFVMEDFENSLKTCRESLDLSKDLEYPRAIIESLTIVVKSLKKLDLDDQEQSAELQELIQLHGIEADPD